VNDPAPRLRETIDAGTARVGVIGLGYVGLPLALAFAENGFPTIGFDIDAAKIACLRDGGTYIGYIPGERVAARVADGSFAPSADFAEIASRDAVIMCVPTPLKGEREPDLRFVTATAEQIARHLRAGQLVVLESTTYPGTTRDVVRPILEAGGLKSGRDFFLAYSPEREDPGNRDHATPAIPKVVGGDGETARDLSEALYGRVVVRTVPVSSMEVAEAVKITENVFRAVNIALVNELKTVYAAMGIDIWEVIEAAKTKPFGFMPFYPGPGLGGHCIPIDPFYLSWRARQVGMTARFVELAGEINTAMPGRVVGILGAELTARFGRSLKGAKVLVVGLAYKKNVEDTRESPALVLLELLEAAGAEAAYHDPHVPVIPATREHARLAGRASVPLNAESIAGFDAALICTDHDAVDYARLVEASPLVIDTRNATAGLTWGRDKIVKA
jgi:UDP-N-acetyl-D-glucosamine dehydrogenase